MYKLKDSNCYIEHQNMDLILQIFIKNVILRGQRLFLQKLKEIKYTEDTQIFHGFRLNQEDTQEVTEILLYLHREIIKILK